MNLNEEVICGFLVTEEHKHINAVYLEMLRDRVGFDKIKEKVVKPLTGRKIGAYYGCFWNQPIYGYANLNYDNVVSQGMASYATSTSDGVSRAGSNPLVVKAVRVEGTTKCNPVVSAEDASKILSANTASHFLDKCAVVFVK